MIIETYHYDTAIQRSNKIMSVLITFYVLLFVASIVSIYYLNKTRAGTVLFWICLVLLIVPLFYNRCIMFLICLIFLIVVFYVPRTISSSSQYSSQNLTLILIVWSILYIVCCYIELSIGLYLYGTTTVYDLQNKEYYDDFISLENLPLQVSDRKKHLYEADQGKKRISSKTAVFGCLARDVEPNLHAMKRRLETLGKYFQDYVVIIYENDSKDRSRGLLQEWSDENPRIILMTCCDEGSCDCNLNLKDMYSYGMNSPARMDKMRTFRQKVLDHVKLYYSHYDYFIIVDFDLPGSFYLDGFFSCFCREDYDMVFGSGLTTFPFVGYVNYDGLAFVAEHQSFDFKDTILNELIDMNRVLKNPKIGDDWIRCKSGFNGMAIYRMDSIKQCSYDNNLQKFKCEHIDLHHDMYMKKSDKIYYNPSLVLFAGHQGKERKDLTLKEYKEYTIDLLKIK